MERLWANWKLLLLVVVVGAVAIQLFDPDWVDLQRAEDAADFQRILGDDTGRATAAGFADIVFAAAYGLLGVAGTRALGGRAPAAMVATGAIAIGAIADEVENVFMIRNINADYLTDGAIDLMQVFGTIKWAATAGYLYFFYLLIRRGLEKRKQRETATDAGP